MSARENLKPPVTRTSQTRKVAFLLRSSCPQELWMNSTRGLQPRLEQPWKNGSRSSGEARRREKKAKPAPAARSRKTRVSAAGAVAVETYRAATFERQRCRGSRDPRCAVRARRPLARLERDSLR